MKKDFLSKCCSCLFAMLRFDEQMSNDIILNDYCKNKRDTVKICITRYKLCTYNFNYIEVLKNLFFFIFVYRQIFLFCHFMVHGNDLHILNFFSLSFFIHISGGKKLIFKNSVINKFKKDSFYYYF